tara:strand:- start:335 stop:628 length:294 start_codon:yes stop_codon:yes gene_type:complete
MKKQNLKEYIDQATKNINDDRAATTALLMGVMKHMKSSDDRHRDFGLIAAKYLETLQRSNEQLVKLAALLQKTEIKNTQMTEEDKQELFDLINEKAE